MQQTAPQLIFGFQAEWNDFQQRNQKFLTCFGDFQKAFEAAFSIDRSLAEPIDKFVFMYGRVCLEDFFEILLCCGNGCGHAAQRLLRGLYERAVTLRYLHEHPDEVSDFLDFHWIGQRKLMIACKETFGADVFDKDMEAHIEAEFQSVKEKFTVTACECGAKRLNYTWNKLDFVSMAKQTQLGKLIVLGYYEPLRVAHATVASMIAKMQLGRHGGIAFEDAAQRDEADKALRVAHNIILDVLRVQDEHFHTPGQTELNQKCLEDFVAIWHSEDKT